MSMLPANINARITCANVARISALCVHRSVIWINYKFAYRIGINKYHPLIDSTLE